MKTNNLSALPLTAILVEDPNIGGYTAYFKQFQNITAEGDTEDEAIHNLVNAVHDVFKYQSEIEDEPIDSKYNVSKKCIDFISNG